MSNTLLIHIGMPKTGTTALQSFLYENKENLKKNEWCYPDLLKEISEITLRAGRSYINGAVFYKEKIQKSRGISHRMDGELIISGEHWDEIWKLILEHLKNSNVVISEEHLWNDAERFLRNAQKEYENIKVVVYLRRQDQAIESFWNQQIKYKYGEYCAEDFNEYVPLHEKDYHYLEKLEQLSGVVGKENLIVRVYEKGQLSGDNAIASDFLTILGIDPDWDRWEKCQMMNSGLSGNYIELKRVMNSLQLAGYMSPPKARGIISELSHIFSTGTGGYFTLQERKNFMEQFAFENERIAREYLYRQDGILFYDSRMDIPRQEVHRSSSFEQDLIRFFMAMICSQMEEIKQLRDYSSAFVEKWLLSDKIKGKKILLFGAGQKCHVLLEELKFPIEMIVDNDERLSGKRLKGILIAHTKMIGDWQDYFVIITCIETGEIEEQLQQLGLEKEKDYILAKEYFPYY